MRSVSQRHLAAIATALLLAGCGDDSSVQQSGVTGLEDSATTGDEVDFAMDFTPYPDAEIQSHITAMGGTMALMHTDASMQDVDNFYRDQASAQSFAIDYEITEDDSLYFRARRDDGAEITVTTTDDGSRRTIDMGIRPGN